MPSLMDKPSSCSAPNGRPRKVIRWTVEWAASEFGINPRTLSARLKQNGATGGDDLKFSTKQIATAIYGDLEREKIRLTSAEADAQERENKLAIGELIEVAEIQRRFAPIMVELVRIVRASALSDADQDALLSQLATAEKTASHG